MKKILLFFGVAAFTSVSAQQNDFFDVEKYLKNKSYKKKKEINNPLSGILKPGCGTLNQNLQNLNPYIYPQKIVHNQSPLPVSNYQLLPNGNKVYTLSQDNMPCIAPDMKEWNVMPNLAYHRLSHSYNWLNKKEPGQIPNAWTRPPVLIHE